MDTSPHTLAALFQQLGLPNDGASIESFLAAHRLGPGEDLAEAPFWTPAQAAFLREALVEDADWCEQADELAARLAAPKPAPTAAYVPDAAGRSVRR